MHPVWAGRRHRRPVGGGRLAAVCARDRATDDPAFPRSPPAVAEPLRLAVQLQPDLQARVSTWGGLALAGLLRNRAGADRPDDRELQVRFPLEPDEAVSLSRHGIAPRRFCERLVVTYCLPGESSPVRSHRAAWPAWRLFHERRPCPCPGRSPC